MTDYKPFDADAAVHDRGHVTEHNRIGSYLNSGGLILNGSGTPTSVLGEPGDFYVDTYASPQVLYGPKGESGWAGPSPLAAVVLTSADLASAVAGVTAATDVDTLKAAVLAFLGTLQSGG